MNELSATSVALLIGLTFVADPQETAAQQGGRTGKEMLPICRAFLEGPKLVEHATAEQALQAGFCAGFIAGMIDETTDACVPPVSGIEAVQKIVNFLEAHPEELDSDFEELVARALPSIWPCQE
jgi:Rap1a immunity proteins